MSDTNEMPMQTIGLSIRRCFHSRKDLEPLPVETRSPSNRFIVVLHLETISAWRSRSKTN